MTNKAYNAVQELLNNKDICDFADRMCKKGEVNPLSDYPQHVDSVVMASGARRQMYLSRAIDLLRRMVFLGATALEVLRASEYLIVILHSMDHSLDYLGCEEALKIKDLERKYSRESFFGMNLPYEDLVQVIKRDNAYYPVPIKEETT
ncbi:MAG: hypothetical protein IKD62_02370 [Oscillospiraceae bacterium]|nr:hypothetical protein [Oscillospiraceae bacterium]